MNAMLMDWLLGQKAIRPAIAKVRRECPVQGFAIVTGRRSQR